MTRKTEIILAWDRGTFNSVEAALLEELLPHIDVVKVGLEAIYATESFFKQKSIAAVVADFCTTGITEPKPIMWDAKLHDIGNTVERAIENIVLQRGVSMLTVHASMSDRALDLAGTACAKACIKTLAVTVLTDIDEEQCFSRFGLPPAEAVFKLATVAYVAGIRGFVCSPKEVSMLRTAFGEEVTLVVPGVRPVWAAANDQKRVMTPAEASESGANYIVVGRPILEPPKGMTPVEAAQRIRAELDGEIMPGSIVNKSA